MLAKALISRATIGVLTIASLLSVSIAGGIPTSINSVQTQLLKDNSLVRIIKHNMEVAPKLEIETLSRSLDQVVDSLVMIEVTVSGKTLNFEDSAGAYIEEISFGDQQVNFSVDYFYKKSGSIYIDCTVDIKNNVIGSPMCTYK